MVLLLGDLAAGDAQRQGAGGHRGGTAHDYDHWAKVEEACLFYELPIVHVEDCLCDYYVGDWCRAKVRKDLYDAPKWRAEARRRRGLP